MTPINARLIWGVAALALAGPLAAAPPTEGSSRARMPGIDFVFVDPEIQRAVPQSDASPLQPASSGVETPHPAIPHTMFADLARGAEQYRADWAKLPEVQIPLGPAMSIGSKDKRVRLLRMRLGLPLHVGYDRELTARVALFQRVHGLAQREGTADSATIQALNRGADYYLRRIAINLERASKLPAPGIFERYVIVDAGSAQAYRIDRDAITDRMRVVVGMSTSKTPMMAVVMRSAKANPYWNVPEDMIRKSVASHVLREGASYLTKGHYDVLSDWTAAGQLLDPATVDWKRVAAGGTTIHVRQRPGPWNAMGAMKFEIPNPFGIYVHDTPNKELFKQTERWRSNGCIRLEDYKRFATWVFERPPQPGSSTEQAIELERPVPVYVTYFTVETNGPGLTFRKDPYGLDDLAEADKAPPAPSLAAATF